MRALVLSGGGSKGSYEAGVIKAFGDSGKLNSGFGLISGTSVGAINAACLAQFRSEDFQAAAKWLSDMWSGSLSVWRRKFPGNIPGLSWLSYVHLLWSSSIGTNKPLESLLDKYFSEEGVRTSGVMLRMPAVELCTGRPAVFTEHSKSIKAGILASSSVPLFFPPQRIGRELFTDGGVRDIAPLGAAIRAGATEIFVILTDDPYVIAPSGTSFTGLQLGKRVLQIILNEVLLNDIDKCRKVNNNLERYPGVKWIKLHVLYPERELADALNFSKKVMQQQFLMGYDDAQRILSGIQG